MTTRLTQPNWITLVFTGFLFLTLHAQESLLPKGANYRLHPGIVNQTEVFIVNSPVDNQVLFATCNTLTFIPFFISEGIYVTSDGGSTWQGNDTCTGEPLSFHGGDPGIAIDKNGIFILTRLGVSPFTGLYSHYSLDQGKTWSSQQAISTDDLERASLISDVKNSSNYAGRTYAAWVKFTPPFPLMISYSDNGAQTWSTPQPINNPSNRSAGGDLAVGPESELFACWAGVTESSPFKEILVGFAKSIDGGVTWEVNENAYPVNGITGILPNKANIRVNGLPSLTVDTTSGERRGWIYIVTGQKDHAPAGNDPDIILHRSADQGVTWSQGIRVNQDPLNNGKTQYFPAIHVDPYGAVNVLFYDDRNTTSDSAGVFLARSTDGGNSWKEYEVSDHNFKPVPIGGLGQGYQGDNIDLTSTGDKIWPVWMDNSTGIYQVWTVPIEFSSIQQTMPVPGKSLTKLKLFPNPISEKTTLEFISPEKGRITIRIYNADGTLVIPPMIREKTNDTFILNLGYSLFMNHKMFLAGVYHCALTIGNETLVTRFVVLD